jgi:alpha-galactosidase
MGIGKRRDGLAPTPPMGWNSWNRFQTNVDERLIRETANAMVGSGMKDAGYQYLVIDDGWEAKQRDESGELVADAERFPGGIATLAEYVHGRGLKLGIYTDVGTATCQGLPGSLGNEERDAKRFASWGVDYVKVDWCHTEGLDGPTQYRTWSRAFQSAGRPMVLSICEWGRHRPWEWAADVGHLWRTCWDIQDSWPSLIGVLDHQRGLANHAGPDGWNDPDMLEVGNGGMSVEEYRAHFSLWCVLAAPLMAGNDLRTMAGGIRAILTAPEVIAVDQDPLGRQGDLVQAVRSAEVWARELADGSKAVVLFNRSLRTEEISVGWATLGWPGGARVRARDLWERADAGTSQEGLTATVPSHAARMFRLIPNLA